MPLQKGEETGMGKNTLMKKKKKKASPSTPLNLSRKIARVEVLFLLAKAFKIAMEIKDISSSDYRIFV